jgi:hypothetical protein
MASRKPTKSNRTAKEGADERNKLSKRDTWAKLHAAAGVNPSEISELIDVINTQSGPSRTTENHQYVAAMTASGCPLDTVWSILNDNELQHVAALHARGIPIEDIWPLCENLWLSDIGDALDAGISLPMLARANEKAGRLDLSELIALAKLDAPQPLIETLLHDDQDAGSVVDARNSGLDWDDIAYLLAGRVPLHHVATRLTDSASDPHAKAIAAIPTRVRALAAVLGAATAAELIDMLPVAAALVGQPWEHTTVSLIGDQLTRTTWTEAYPHILAARALHEDPTLPRDPKTTGPGAETTTVSALETIAGRAAHATSDPGIGLGDALVALGVHPDAAAETATWAGVNAHHLQRARTPQHGSITIPAVDAIAAALVSGSTFADIRAIASSLDRNGQIPIADAALTAALGIDPATAADWSQRGADTTLTALLTAHGLPADTAHACSQNAGGWHTLELLRAGAAPEEAARALPAFGERDAGETWDTQRRNRTPVPVNILIALAEHGVTLDQVNEAQYVGGDDHHQIPEAVTVNAARISGQIHAQGTRMHATSAIISYAAAVTGQPWAAAATRLRKGPDARIAITTATLSARGLTAPTRRINPPGRQQHAPAAQHARS